MFEKAMARSLMAAALRMTAISLGLLLSVFGVARGAIITETSTGVGSLTIPTGYEWINVTIQCWGGGGGGAASNYSSGVNFGGGGGGGGAYSSKTYTTPLVAGAYSYYVGVGGAAGTTQGNNGGFGGKTIWNYGGDQDIYVTGGGGGSIGTIYGDGPGGFPGSVTSGVGCQGGSGGSGTHNWAYNYIPGGGGGGSGGPSSAGGNGGAGESGAPGDGGSGGTGYGAGGAGGSASNAAHAGAFPGGGGGGGGLVGAAGANGEIIITYTPEAMATIVLSNALSATIITGGTGTLGATIGNSASANLNLNFTATATVQSGSAILGLVSPATGVISPGSTQPCTIPATSTNLGTNTISLTASDPNSSNLNQTATATLTVWDHSNASLSSTATQTTQTINFGNVLRGATIPSQNFAIYNLAPNTSAGYTANLKLTTGFTTTGDGAMTTNLAPFNGLQAATNGNTFTASLNTSNYTTTGITTVTMSASQLADDSALPGAGNNNKGGLTITLDANVGTATADKSNSQTSFGTSLTAPVAQNASYANLESMATATTGSGGYDLVGSTATILAGTNLSGSAQTVSMAWRTQTQAERNGPGLISDVVDLSGMTLSGSSGQTSKFVLQLNYNPILLPGGAGNEGLWASNEWIYLGWLNPSTDTWQNAVLGNFGSSNDHFVGIGAWGGDTTLGDWGVNTANDTVWAVLNHNSDFAVVPEPSALVLLAVGAIGFLGGICWRRRMAKPTAFDESESSDDTPAILAFPSHAAHQPNVARRAA